MGIFDKVKAILSGAGRPRTTAQTGVDPDSDLSVARAERAVRLRRHTVLPGETLVAIADLHGVSGPEMAALNGIQDPELIYPGQVFRVPHGASAPHPSS